MFGWHGKLLLVFPTIICDVWKNLYCLFKINLRLLIKNWIVCLLFFSFAIIVEDLNGKHRLAKWKTKVWDNKKKDSRMI